MRLMLDHRSSGGEPAVERLDSTIRPMRRHRIVVSIAIVTTALAVGSGRALPTPTYGGAQGAQAGSSAAEYSRAVTQICARALLFDHSHHLGTRRDALAVARDIRASTARRLARVTALSVPPELRPISNRWISSQRLLAASYARAWVRIYDAIDAARTPTQKATLARRLHQLVHAPDRLRLVAGRLELELHVPDCTGGG